MPRIGRALFGALRRARTESATSADLAVGDVLGYRAPSGRIYLLRVTALLDMGGGCVQPAIRFLDYAQAEPPAPEMLAGIPERRRHPRWKKVELRIVDDEAPTRERLGVTTFGRAHEPQESSSAPDPKAACEWAEVVAYLNSRDELGTSRDQ
jgi:hypothetical protein